MRLGLYFLNHVPDAEVVWYQIQVVDETGENILSISHEEKEKLSELHPRIEKMCRKILGHNFQRLDDSTNHTGSLDLCVSKGTSKGPLRFSFRSLCGWIELCDYE